jgi:aminomethyltransferase
MSDQINRTVAARTELHALHLELGARMVAFAGYEMPVQYSAGIIAEHHHTRSHASLFDVSHMGQVAIRGPNPASALEALVPGDIKGLAPGRTRYSVLTNDTGGIIDDLMVTNVGEYLFLVINASRRQIDIDHLRRGLAGYEIDTLDRGLLALQGPAAASVLERLAPGVITMPFMSAAPFVVDGCPLAVTRGGYTGEDGFEISIPAGDVERIALVLLDHDDVEPAGLGARDTLRLEAGLCLYGNDIDEDTTPVEAGLRWIIGKRRREQGGFPGEGIILDQIRDGPPQKLVGLTVEGRSPARAHAEIRDRVGRRVGEVTSGGFGPTIGGAIALGYVEADSSVTDTAVSVMIRDKEIPAKITKLPFVPHNYYKP